MEEGLVDERRPAVDAFHLLSSHVLPLLQLEDVLLAIDDPHGVAPGEEHPDISSLQSPIGRDCFFCLRLVLVVAFEGGVTPNPDFPSRRGPAFLVLVVAGVQLELQATLNHGKVTATPPTFPTLESYMLCAKEGPVHSV